MSSHETAKALSEELKKLTLGQRMASIGQKFPELIFTTSFSTEDQLMSWAILDADAAMPIKTHLTGKMLDYARTLKSIMEVQYDIKIPTGAENGGALWISGRAQHRQNADQDAPLAVWHEDKNMLEINPLADWTFTEVLTAVAAHEVPINPLTGFVKLHTSHPKVTAEATATA